MEEGMIWKTHSWLGALVAGLLIVVATGLRADQQESNAVSAANHAFDKAIST